MRSNHQFSRDEEVEKLLNLILGGNGSYIEINYGDRINFKSSGATTLNRHKETDPATGQVTHVISISSTDSGGTSDTAGWKYLGLLPDGADLNTYTTAGWLDQQTSTSASTGTNYPTPRAGILRVYGREAVIHQEYTRFDVNETWTRQSYNGAWSPWKLEFNQRTLVAGKNTEIVKTGSDIYSINAKGGEGTVIVTASRNLTAADNQKTLICRNSSSDIVLTVPTGLGVDFSCNIVSEDSGTRWTQLAAGTGVTLKAPHGTKILTHYTANIIKRTNEEVFNLQGELTP